MVSLKVNMGNFPNKNLKKINLKEHFVQMHLVMSKGMPSSHEEGKQDY
jgi:hypothetical protein